MIHTVIEKFLDRLGDLPFVRDDVDLGDLDPLRKRIDILDQMLLELLNERARAANIIGDIKKKLDLPVYAPRREEQVLEQVRNANKGPLPDASVRHLFERIIDETRSLERQLFQHESEQKANRTDRNLENS
jgi:chorismate mutase